MTEASALVFVLESGEAAVIRTAVGIDQGCPGSVVAFALGMRRAINRIKARLPAILAELGLDASSTPCAFFSFLDDLTVVVGAALAPACARSGGGGAGTPWLRGEP